VILGAAGDLYGDISVTERRQGFLVCAAKRPDSLMLNSGQDSNSEV
jgi:hypothetical protein